MFSVVSVCVSLRLFGLLTFESLNLETSFLLRMYIFRVSMSRSHIGLWLYKMKGRWSRSYVTRGMLNGRSNSLDYILYAFVIMLADIRLSTYYCYTAAHANALLSTPNCRLLCRLLLHSARLIAIGCSLEPGYTTQRVSHWLTCGRGFAPTHTVPTFQTGSDLSPRSCR